MNNIIRFLKSYEDIHDIRGFVRDAIASDPEITKLLRRSQAKVVVKPNWVQESHEDLTDVWEPVISHPAVVLAAVDALCEAMQRGGILVVCDAAHTYASFAAIVARGGFDAEFERLKIAHPHIRLEVVDLRREVWKRTNGVVVSRTSQSGDPAGYVRFDLAADSLLFGHSGEGRYYGADYDKDAVNSHHRGRTQEYLLGRTPIECDLFVNVPKLKTHKKTGVTCCLKNLVGINGDKNWLPHHAEGTLDEGGDERPFASLATRLETRAKDIGVRAMRSIPGLGPRLYAKARGAGLSLMGDSGRTIRNGNWSGNDTCWRMALDLNRCLLYGNADGTFRDTASPKPYLAIVDGIVGGEGDGPLRPDPVASGVLLAGTNPAEVDAVAGRLMGFDPAALPIVHNAFAGHRWPITTRRLDDVRAFDGRVVREISLADVSPAVRGGFRPHFGWASLKKPEDNAGPE